MNEESSKHSSERVAERIAGGVTALSIIVAAVIHIINFLPNAYSTLFPRHDLRLLGFNSQERIVIANRGDFDYFISHVRYGPNYEALSGLALNDRASDILQDQLPAMCDNYFDAQLNEDQINNCRTRLERALHRVERVPTEGRNQELWAPGFKNRGIAQALNSGVTEQFELRDPKWGRCPVVSSANAQQWQALLAMWISTYQTIPGRCLNVEYYYVKDRNFIALAGRYDELNLMPASGSLRYYSMNQGDEPNAQGCPVPALADKVIEKTEMCSGSQENSVAECSVKASCLKRIQLPTLVGIMRYNNSKFCTDEIQKIAAFSREPSSSGTDCLASVE